MKSVIVTLIVSTVTLLPIMLIATIKEKNNNSEAVSSNDVGMDKEKSELTESANRQEIISPSECLDMNKTDNEKPLNFHMFFKFVLVPISILNWFVYIGDYTQLLFRGNVYIDGLFFIQLLRLVFLIGIWIGLIGLKRKTLLLYVTFIFFEILITAVDLFIILQYFPDEISGGLVRLFGLVVPHSLIIIYYYKRKSIFKNYWFKKINADEYSSGIIYCRKCGTKLEGRKMRFCMKCGTEVMQMNSVNERGETNDLSKMQK